MPALVGREPERDELLDALDGARSGRGRVALVYGEAGIGKTSLVQQLGDDASRLEFDCVWATCSAEEAAPAFWPWVQVVRALATRHADLVEAEPEFALMVPDLSPTGVREQLTRHEPEEARFRLFDVVTRVLLRASARAPLVIVLEDLHWSDASSLLLLEFVAHEVEHARVLVVGTYRDVEVSRGEPRGRALEGLPSTTARIPLGPLGVEGVASLIARLTGAEVDPSVVPELHRRTGGNPLFVREVVRLAKAQGAALGTHAVPPGVRAVIERRLARLPQPTHELLAPASVIGSSFDVDMLAEAAQCSVGACVEALEPALSARLVTERPLPGAYSFSHELVRDCVYELLPATSRASLHGRVAAAIIRREPSDLDPRVAELAHHLSRSLTADSRDVAIDMAVRAARRAQSMLAYEDAARWYRQALEMLARDEDDSRLTILLELGDAELAGADLEQSRASFAAAIEIARRAGRSDQFARAALGLGAGLAGFEVRLHDRHQIDVLAEALDVLPPDDSVLRAWVLARLSVAASFSELDAARVGMSREAVEMARRLGDDGALAYALSSLCDAIAGPDHVEERLGLADEMIGRARLASDRPMELLARRFRLVALLERGDIAGFDAEAGEFSSLAVALSQPLSLWYVPLIRGMRALLRGRFDEARRLADEAEVIGRRVGSDNAEMLCMTLRGAIDVDRGCFDRMLADFDALLERYPEAATYPSARAQQSCLLALNGQRAAAQAELDAMAAEGLDTIRRDAEWLLSIANLAQACSVLDDASHAGELLELLRPYERQFPVDGIAAACYGSVARYLGLLATMSERFEDAERHFDHARREHERVGAPILAAHVDRDRADMHLRRNRPGDRERALTLYRRACDIYRELGAPEQVRRIEAHLEGAAFGDTASAIERGRNVFRRNGDVWHFEYSGRDAVMRDAKGLRDLAHLLAAPGEPIHVADLVAATAGAPEARQADRGAEILDARARAEYRSRLEELRTEIDDAERAHDPARAERARAEHDFLAGELASALGLGGRSRRLGDAAERARKAVGARIGMSMSRMAQIHPELARHLRDSVSTGTFCAYAPEHATPWRL